MPKKKKSSKKSKKDSKITKKEKLNQDQIKKMLSKALVFEENVMTNALHKLEQKIEDKESKKILRTLLNDTLKHSRILSQAIKQIK